MVIGITMVKVVPGQERSVYCSLKGKDRNTGRLSYIRRV